MLIVREAVSGPTLVLVRVRASSNADSSHEPASSTRLSGKAQRSEYLAAHPRQPIHGTHGGQAESRTASSSGALTVCALVNVGPST